jgi:hypothetical protein
MELQKQFGEKWFVGAFDRLNTFDTTFLFACIRIGAKKDEKPFKIDIDSIDAPVKELAMPVLNALYVSVQGKTFDEYIQDVEAAMKAANLSGESPLADGSSPENSSAN